MLLCSAPSVHAEDFLNWLETATGSQHRDEEFVEVDGAELITLESRESEMYPMVSPDGKYFLTLSTKKQQHMITRRLVENGDPINVVIEHDVQALNSIAWYSDDIVTFLSYRADSLGLWQKPVDRGVVKRLHGRLDGELIDPVLLGGGSIIAVRLHAPEQRLYSKGRKSKQPNLAFDNWNMKGKQAHLVRISANGAEEELASGLNPSLSADGERVVFSMQSERSWHLFMMNVDGSDLIQLTEGDSIDVQPTWSPDGKSVAFTSNRADEDEDDHHSAKANWDVWMISYDGRNLTRLTTDKARDGAPEFAKNGRIYFHSDRKVDKAARADHQVRGSTKGFHVWSAMLPAIN
ncbi:MAG: hypothetical protein Q9M17_10065 [Mariprofundus sp.]|nr:hypothetical protein [Mariprofundus sp.]